MKTFLLSILLTSGAATLLCQTPQHSFRFADTSAVWTQCQSIFFEGPQGIDAVSHTDVYGISKDSFFNNFTYQKITPGLVSPSAFVRQDSTRKVFLYDFDLQSDRMIYDFGLNKNDTLRLYNSLHLYHPSLEDTIKLVVDSTDTVIYGTARKRMFLRCITGTYCTWYRGDVVIEGIGSLNSHFLSPYVYEFWSIPGRVFELLSFKESGSLHNFSSNCEPVAISEVSSDKINIYPNPTNSTLHVIGTSLTNTFYLYNFLGQQKLQHTFTNSTTINIEQLTNGIYLYELRNSKGVTQTGKIVKQ